MYNHIAMLLEFQCAVHLRLWPWTMFCFRNRAVRRGTRWISAASPPPFRSCSSTGPRTLQCQSSSPCRPLTASVLLLLATPTACTVSPACRPPTPSPTPPPAPPLPPPATPARVHSAQTTRWRCQNTVMPWCSPSLLRNKWVNVGGAGW